VAPRFALDRVSQEAGMTLVELIVVVACLGAVVGGVTTLFSSGINADGDQTRRFGAQQDARVAMDRLTREAHAACSISAYSTYNTPLSTVTLWFPSGSTCASSTTSVTWCTTASGSQWVLNRVVGTSCSGTLQVFSRNLRTATPFVYLPPSSHFVTSTSLGLGTSTSYVVTQDGSSSLPRLYVDLPVNTKPSVSHDLYELKDAVALRNGPRACSSGATC
jgi:type II secretory pathway pseudopilin PulG